MGGIHMAISKKAVEEIAKERKFNARTIEKVLRLMAVLNEIADIDALKSKLVLKGGTALNLFLLDLPRLSVDIDLNYIGALNVEEMKLEKVEIEKILKKICARLGMNMQTGPTEHAGGKWVVQYQSVVGGSDTIQIDMNFLYRVPLWAVDLKQSSTLGDFTVKSFQVLSYSELYAGKLRALLSRRVSRDFYDASKIGDDIDTDKLRLALVIYGAMNPKDWRTVSIDELDCTAKDIKERLLPLLNHTELPPEDSVDAYAATLVKTVKEKLSVLFPLSENESEFVRRVREDGVIEPTLITADTALAEIVRQHPSLLWRASKAKK
jgi:predicted nucleotidyltransferase component of viral defense system